MNRRLIRGAWILALLSVFFAACSLAAGVLHTGVWALLALGSLCVLWALLAGKSAAPRLRRWLGGVILAALAGGLLLSVPMAAQAFFQPPDGSPAVAVVLGAKVRADGSPSRILKNRLDTAADLLEAEPQLVCVVAGGQGKNEPVSEALAMARYLEGRGIDPGRVLLEDQSRNTEENLANTAALLREEGLPSRVILITDSFHQLRAAAQARRQGLDVFSLSSPTPWALFPAYWVREFFGICSLAVFR